MRSSKLKISGVEIPLGEVTTLQLNAGRLYDSTEMKIPIRVFRGKKPGPTLFVSAAIHGDEIIGVEILRRLMQTPHLRDLRGTLIAAPIVNVFGFNMRSRYLPDRRDLNRSFPGSGKGSLAARLADLFVREVVHQSDYGIDIHSGAVHRFNIPQIRVDTRNSAALKLANAFGASVCLHSGGPDGSLRHACSKNKIPILVYEGGEALRFDESAVEVGFYGVLRVMAAVEMISKVKAPRVKRPYFAKSSHWVRAPQSGILKKLVAPSTRVREGDVLAIVSDPFGENGAQVLSPKNGVIIGSAMLPLVNRGDALYHIATTDEGPSERVELYNEDFVETLGYGRSSDLKFE